MILHGYERPVDIPEGIELFDAEQIMPKSEIVAHRSSGSLALASDIYRYRILRSGLGIYADCDIYCVRPFPDDDFLFGWESDTFINGAVLAIPSNHPALDDLVAFSSDRNFIPWWYRERKKRWLRLRKAAGFPVPTSRQRWGTIGPHLITHVVAKHGLTNHAMPSDVFYPINHNNTKLLFDKELTIDEISTRRTLGIHLSSSLLSGKHFTPGSILDAIVNSR